MSWVSPTSFWFGLRLVSQKELMPGMANFTCGWGNSYVLEENPLLCILINWYSIKLSSKPTSVPLDKTSFQSQRNFFWQCTAVNEETYKLSKYREQLSMECSATNGTSLLYIHSLTLRRCCGREGTKIKCQRSEGTAVKQFLLNTTWLLQWWTHRSYGLFAPEVHKFKPDDMQVSVRGGPLSLR